MNTCIMHYHVLMLKYFYRKQKNKINVQMKMSQPKTAASTIKLDSQKSLQPDFTKITK